MLILSYWVLVFFLAVGIFFPVIGFLAIICMLGPVLMAVRRGRHWCGNVCPRGNFYDRVVDKFSPHKEIPPFLRSTAMRAFMVAFIFMVFGVQMYRGWGDWAAMGSVFVQIILVTTIAGIILGRLYHQRAWCTFCPMGTLSAVVAPRQPSETGTLRFKVIAVADHCVSCKYCHKVCPMQLHPYMAKGDDEGFRHQDCLKCGKCIEKCPKKALLWQ